MSRSVRRGSGKAAFENVWLSFLISLSVSVAAWLISAFIAAAISGATEDPTGAIGLCALISLLASGLIGGAFAARIGDMGFSLLVSLTVTMLMLATSLIMTGGVSLSCLMNGLTYMGAGTAGAFVGKRRERRRRHR